MSIKVMNRVWDHSKANGTDLVIMLALADRADEDGVAWPGIAYLCQKARVKERATQTIIRKLEDSGELFIENGAGRKHTNYYIVLTGLEPEQIKQILMDRLDYSEDEAQGIVAGIAEKMQNHAPIKKDAKPMQKGAKPRTKGAKPRHEKVHSFAPDPLINPSLIPLSLCATHGGQKLQELLNAEYSAKNRRPPDKFKTLEMKNKWVGEVEGRLPVEEIERAIKAALALNITSLERIVAYAAKWGLGNKYHNATPAGQVQKAPAQQQEDKGMYL